MSLAGLLILWALLVETAIIDGLGPTAECLRSLHRKKQAGKQTHNHTHTRTRMHTDGICIYIYTYVCMYIYICIFILYVFVYIYIYIYIYCMLYICKDIY